MDVNAADGGFVLLCDEDGAVCEILSDEAELLPHVESGTPLPHLMAEGSRDVAHAFVEAVREQGAAFGWGMRIAGIDAEQVRLSGVAREGLIQIVGVVYQGKADPYSRALLKANNEQINRHRSAVKEERLRARAQLERQEALLDDITRLNNELVAAQRELARKNAALQRLDEQKNQFLGMAAHDLRNPLSNVLMLCDMLLNEAADALGDRHRKLIARIRQAGKRMLTLIDDFLDVASIESGKLRLRPRPVDLSDLLAHNVAANRAMAEQKDIDIKVRDAEELPPVVVDPDKIEQVLNNLISNAVKYSPRQAKVDVQLRQENGRILIAVSDTGPGIPADEQNRIFQPFAQTSVQSTAGEKSTGLGLMIVKKIVEGHGGTIEVESEPGRGSTFTVSLPLDQHEAASAAPADVEKIGEDVQQ